MRYATEDYIFADQRSLENSALERLDTERYLKLKLYRRAHTGGSVLVPKKAGKGRMVLMKSRYRVYNTASLSTKRRHL